MQQKEDQALSALGLFIWFLATLFFLYEFFLRAVLGTLANEFMPDLGLSAETFAWLGSAYYLTYAVMQVPVGILTDRFGLKSILFFAAIVCAIATLLFAHAHGFTLAFLARALMGFGSSFAFICVLVIVANWLPKKSFAFFIGVSQFVGTMGPLLAGGPLASLLTYYHGRWREVVEIVAMVGFALAFVILFFVKNKSRSQTKKSVVLLQPPGMMRESLWRMLRNKQVWAVATYSGCIYIGMPLIGELWGASFLQSAGFSLENAASAVSVSWLGYAIGSLALGAFSDMLNRRKNIMIGSALLGLFVTTCFSFLHLGSYWIYVILFFLLGAAASGQSVAFAAIAEHAELCARATALGLNNAFITFFAVIIPPIVGSMIGAHSQGHQIEFQDYAIGFTLMPCLYIVALLVAFFLIKETYCKPQKETIFLQVG